MTATTSFATEINFVTTTQDVNSPRQVFQASVVTIKLHLVFNMEYQNSFQLQNGKAIILAYKFSPFLQFPHKNSYIL